MSRVIFYTFGERRKSNTKNEIQCILNYEATMHFILQSAVGFPPIGWKVLGAVPLNLLR